MRKIFKWLLGIALLALIAIQFIPVQRTNPPVTYQPNWDSPATEAMARRACFDCHSNETNWPWYAYVAPVSWRITEHVREGRRKFNISEGKWHDTEEIVEEVERDKMPLWDYLLMHSEAKFTEAEKQTFLIGLEKTFSNSVKTNTRGQEGGEQHEHNEEHNEQEH
ncbi:MAG: heme-binding domain-containing protein [Deferribacteres bacterium]|nr:heme-binding domain-containing protein [candidate division KSB1 bacterium]MCB9511095.1 heme-binding domain-containing protein [Deferribacteres bacterium]